MTLDNILDMLEETGYPVAYDHFPKENPPDVPYIALRFPYSENFFADDKTYKQLVYVEVELCTLKKDPLAEKKLIDIFYNHDITWQKTSEEFIEEDDGLFSIYFEFKMIYEL